MLDIRFHNPLTKTRIVRLDLELIACPENKVALNNIIAIVMQEQKSMASRLPLPSFVYNHIYWS